jgi:pimeloyl-ACP methyl ester carboxylesterase
MAPQLAPDEEGWIWMPDESFARAFAQNATADQIALTKAVQRPISVKCIQEPAPEPAWAHKPTWFLIAEEDRMINPKTQQFMAERMGAQSQALPVDHAPLLTAPETVVDMVLRAAQAA